jgi:hypothetical protein
MIKNCERAIRTYDKQTYYLLKNTKKDNDDNNIIKLSRAYCRIYIANLSLSSYRTNFYDRIQDDHFGLLQFQNIATNASNEVKIHFDALIFCAFIFNDNNNNSTTTTTSSSTAFSSTKKCQIQGCHSQATTSIRPSHGSLYLTLSVCSQHQVEHSPKSTSNHFQNSDLIDPDDFDYALAWAIPTSP